jgi:hypothetical protein
MDSDCLVKLLIILSIDLNNSAFYQGLIEVKLIIEVVKLQGNRYLQLILGVVLRFVGSGG